MSEPKNVDKICPIFGAQRILGPVPNDKIIQGVIFQPGYDLINCQRERCQLWEEFKNDCSIKIGFAFSTTIGPCIKLLNSSLDKLCDILLTKLKEPHGNS